MNFNFEPFRKVVYAPAVDGVPAKYQYSQHDYEIHEWLNENCKKTYYYCPPNLREKYVLFECDLDAVHFMLRWT